MEMARRDATRIIAPLRSNELEKILVEQARAGNLVVRLIGGGEQNIQAHDEYVMLRAQGIAADVVQGLSPLQLQNDSPFPIDIDIQNAILRSAS
jgi:siroheme synthase